MNYRDFIEQTTNFPTKEFRVIDNELYFHDVRVLDVVEKYGTPLKMSYLPKISENIKKAGILFELAFKKNAYPGSYIYCYCTKSSHFKFVLENALKAGAHIETSSSFDIPLIRRLYENESLSKEIYIICNGFKQALYKQYIIELINEGFRNCIPVLDNMNEVHAYESGCNEAYPIGIRVAVDEPPGFAFYTSRLGIRYSDILNYYQNHLKPNTRSILKILHFFVSTGIHDTLYFWQEFNKFVELYCELRKECDSLTILDLGGGLPIKTSLNFEFDYEGIISRLVRTIKDICSSNHVPAPDIFTEFGSFTVGESGAILYSILENKLQNDKEIWYIIDGSFITQLPDSWSQNRKFILLPLNLWKGEYHRVNLGGLTCDSMDYYNTDIYAQDIYLPKIKTGESMIIGFFHTGAYQESLGGYGGIQHCLIPSPKHVLISNDANGTIAMELFRDQEGPDTMLDILGYH